MTFVAPFDDSRLAQAALVRATEYGKALDEEVVAVAVVPDSKEYAVEKGWIREADRFDRDAVVETLHRSAMRLAPSAGFRARRVAEFVSPVKVGSILKETARDLGASVLFVGSENAGRTVASLTSVGRVLSADEDFDVHVVKRKMPPKVDRLDRKSDFYFPDG